jgi:hypothetical protein
VRREGVEPSCPADTLLRRARLATCLRHQRLVQSSTLLESLGPVPLPLGHEDDESLRAESNRLPAAYEAAALPGELRRRRLPGKDSNLDSVGQGHVSCHWTTRHQSADRGSRTRTRARFEPIASASWATPAYAARDSNPDNPG